MEEFIARYRNASLLIAVLFLQFVLLGYQVKTGNDVRLMRIWTAALIAPIESVLKSGTGVVGSLWSEYVWLWGTREENSRLKANNETLQLENQQLRRAVTRFSREEEVLAYQNEIPSQTVLAQVIGVGSNPNAREVRVDKGTRDGVKSGMAVITPDGVVGKVQAAYGQVSLVLLMDDVDSGVGVLLKNSRSRGVLKGTGRRECRLEYIDTEVEVAVGEAVYTSGEDRVFPRGLPCGEVTRIGPVSDYREIWVRPFAALGRLEEVLIVTVGVHGDLPRFAAPQPPEVLMPMPPSGSIEPSTLTKGFERNLGSGADAPPGEAGPEGQPGGMTEADVLFERYRSLGVAQRHRFGEGDLGTPPPDFNFGLPFSTTPPLGAENEPALPSPVATEPVRAPQPGGPNQTEPGSSQQSNSSAQNNGGEQGSNDEGGSNGSSRNP